LDSLTASANRLGKQGAEQKWWEPPPQMRLDYDPPAPPEEVLIRRRLKKHFDRMNELVAQGMGREEASAQAYREVTGKTALLTNPLLGPKLGYGYDISGEEFEQGGTSGQDEHLWDQGTGDKADRTNPAPANIMVDSEAEGDFPELVDKKQDKPHWPPRTR